MNLYDRDIQKFKRIVQGDGGMGVSGGIDNHPADIAAFLLDPCDQFPLMVALAEINQKAQFVGFFYASFFKIT